MISIDSARHIGQPVVFEVNAGDDGIADMAGLRTEKADGLHHVQQRAPRQLRGLLIGVVGGIDGGRKEDGKQERSAIKRGSIGESSRVKSAARGKQAVGRLTGPKFTRRDSARQ